MLPIAAHLFSQGASIGEIEWTEALACIAGVGAVAFLSWQLWHSQRLYALELAEQSRQLSEAQEKIVRAGEDAEAVGKESQAKSEMLATLSREIRANLNGIIGSADLMLGPSLKPEQREHLARLRASAESLHRSLNDVLDYSSIETGQIQIGNAPFELRQPLIEVVESLAPLGMLKGLELALIVAPDTPAVVHGDAGRLRQVLLNLMANAVKHTSSGRVVLRAELPPGSSAVSRQGGTWLRFSVSDTGAGIPDETRATIFERAAHSDSPSARSGGSGLELAISKRLVELMGGQIGARNLPEGGSEFWVILAPVAERPQAPAPSPAEDLHVAVLEDHAASRIAAAAMLSRMGIDYDATDTLAKAAVSLREAHEAGARDLVLLVDESAAREAGETLARTLSEDAALQSTRVVLMSRNAEEPHDGNRAFPVSAIVRKPLLRSEALLAALRPPPGAAGPAVSHSRSPFELKGAQKAAIRGVPRVLVVDDDEISRSVSSHLLRRMGCAVELAASGEEAVEYAQAASFELVFMDCQMPGMDGFAATGKILAAAGDRAPPVVALTANSSDRDRQKCFAAGMCDFVSKPVNQVELTRVLKRWIQPAAAP